MTGPPIYFEFPGYGPELSRGIAILVDDERVLVTDDEDNPGTSVSNAVEAAAREAARALGAPPDVAVLQWRRESNKRTGGVWRVGDAPDHWQRITNIDHRLRQAMEAVAEGPSSECPGPDDPDTVAVFDRIVAHKVEPPGARLRDWRLQVAISAGAAAVLLAIVQLTGLGGLWAGVGLLVALAFGFALSAMKSNPIASFDIGPTRLRATGQADVLANQAAKAATAQRDPETGLLTRTAFERQLEGWERLRKRYETPFALVLIEVTAAESRREFTMESAAMAIAGAIRDVDAATRIASNKFAVLLPSQVTSGALQLGRRLSRAFQTHPALTPTSDIAIGIAVAGFHAYSVGALWEAAATAAVRAKATPDKVAEAPERVRPQGDLPRWRRRFVRRFFRPASETDPSEESTERGPREQ